MDNYTDAFICNGISLGKPTEDGTPSIELLENAIFLDANGNLHITDEYIKSLTDEFGNPITSLSLKDLYLRIKGIFSQGGQLYFKDESVSRPYSLQDIIGSYTSWKSKLINSNLYWSGRTKITNDECYNVIVDVTADPNDCELRISENINATGTKVFSIDRYIKNEYYTSSLSPEYRRKTDGSWQWHDVPNMKIITPTLDDDKIAYIIAKLPIRLVYTIDYPVVFRLYNETLGIELDRVSFTNNVKEDETQQVTLTYSGKMSDTSQTPITCTCPGFTPAPEIDEPHNTIKVQFYVDNYYHNDGTSDVYNDNGELVYLAHERRLFGIPNPGNRNDLSTSSIDVLLYNTLVVDKVGRKIGQLSFNSEIQKQVIFDIPFDSADYSISLSNNKNINMWYDGKTSKGFTIKAENKFTGTVDWTAIKVQKVEE